MTPNEEVLRAYTIALGYVQSRDRDAAIALLQERIQFYRDQVKIEDERRSK